MSFYISRFKGIESQNFDIEIITPLFLGGADPKKAELRVPSIKGALRFWWRALYGSENLADMKSQEAEIFGSIAKKASFSLHIKDTQNANSVLADLPQGIKVPTTSKGRTFKISIIEYLAYGLCEYNKQFKRNIYVKEHIPAGSRFKIVLRFYDNFKKDEILNSFKVLINFGGLGSRSRNGFGSISSKKSSIGYKNEGTMKSYTAFSEMTKLFEKFTPKDKWEDALSEIGKVYRKARNNLENKHVFEKRSLIAKPLIVKGEVNINDRHSKPYFLHVNKLHDGKHQGQILYMPYNYYKQGKREEYFQACEQVNQKILELSGDSR
ncbi:MAG: type III-B CRISPR module RAMP protein Cmr1 [Deltaproteobacteria bacterium]|nr:type III-B CRISPR module RAMP protein Cmr1 [Deltaproteobacteria bacterium]